MDETNRFLPRWATRGHLSRISQILFRRSGIMRSGIVPVRVKFGECYMSTPDENLVKHLEQLRIAILQVLQDGQDHEFMQVVSALKTPGVEKSVVKAAIWRMYA